MTTTLDRHTQIEEIPDDLISVEELKKLFGVTRATVTNWRSAGLFNSYRIGGTVRFSRSEVIRAVRVTRGSRVIQGGARV